MLQVNTAYHSKHIEPASRLYRRMLETLHKSESGLRQRDVTMFSTVSGVKVEGPFSLDYWVQNIVSPVKFFDAMSQMVAPTSANFLVEVSPSNTLASPISQILKSVASAEAGDEVTASVPYQSVSERGSKGLYPLYAVAGAVFAAGGNVDFCRVNSYGGQEQTPSVLVDLPNYPWNHTIKYWHESPASRDWRYRPFPRHDLLGSKVLATGWDSPIWHNRLSLDRIPWLLDHRVGEQVVFSGSGYVCMAMEAVYQTMSMTEWKDNWPQSFRYRFKDVAFRRAMLLKKESETSVVMLTLTKPSVMLGSWYEFKVSSRKDDTEGIWHDHATGLVQLESQSTPIPPATESIVPELQQPVPTMTWYKYMHAAGLNYGLSFQKHIAIWSLLALKAT
ncbi:polyketide synthase dehydratase-domain-containing protein [Nemania sp. FL0916]|nr:polyketide synthase dehydratase-domain-containing protein [Nemania sp. FL0916]